MSDLPPLHALRAFEAAARRESFKLAARELFVTPGAISQQVKALEAALGRALFVRRTRAVGLTEAGRELLPAVQEAFAGIARATARLREHERRGPLTVSVLPSFAVKWLVPRLGRFRARHPEIEVRIVADRNLATFSRDGVDVAIRHGWGRYPGLHAVWLMGDELFPVCSPRLPGWPKSLRKPADLARHVLIHDETTRDWEHWLRAAGLPGVDGTRGPVYSDAILAIQAAIEGQGVAITRGELVERELATGQLVRPFSISMPADFASYVVCPQETAQLPKIAAFRDWLVEETGPARARARPAGVTGLPAAMPLPCVTPPPRATRSLRRKAGPPSATGAAPAAAPAARRTGGTKAGAARKERRGGPAAGKRRPAGRPR